MASQQKATQLATLSGKCPIVVTMRTADRGRGQNRRRTPNYLGQTVRALVGQGLDPADLHLFPTDPDIAWLDKELDGLPVSLHVPDGPRNPNENALAQISALDTVAAAWVLLLEDDLDFCADFLGSVTRWLRRHAHPDIHVYRFFSFQSPAGELPESYVYPLWEQVGSQAVALRAGEAGDLVAWARANQVNWRPIGAPFRHLHMRGFDKMIGYWALSRWPNHTEGLVSRPFFVRHLGAQSSLLPNNARALSNNHRFAGTNWQYNLPPDEAPQGD